MNSQNEDKEPANRSFISSIVLFWLASVWNMIAFVICNMHFIGRCREYYPWKSKALMSIYVIINLLTRVFASTMFFTPALGLFNLLRHLQAEQLPGTNFIAYTKNGETRSLYKYFSQNGTSWDSVYRFTDYAHHPQPSYILYTLEPMKVYFYVFVLLIFLHLISIFIFKYIWIRNCFKETKGNDFTIGIMNIAIHALENTILPLPFEEWETKKFGDCQDHIKRQKKNEKETITVILINLLFNLIYLFPMIILSKFL